MRLRNEWLNRYRQWLSATAFPILQNLRVLLHVNRENLFALPGDPTFSKREKNSDRQRVLRAFRERPESRRGSFLSSITVVLL